MKDIDNIFQSTLPRGERRVFDGSNLYVVNFNPRSREGSDGKKFISGKYQKNFNPRSREGSDSGQLKQFLNIYGFQSTLPRGERLLLRPVDDIVINISIHAPARGATEKNLYLESIKKISIHAPARGATSMSPRSGSSSSNFNPRSREGSDGIERP